MMKRKLLAVLMAVAMVFGLAACGNSEEAPAGNAGTTAAADTKSTEGDTADTQAPTEDADDEEDEDVAEIVVAYPMAMVAPEIQLVEDAINEITVEKINTQVKLMPFEIGSYNDQINLMISSGEKLDTMVTFFYGSTEFTSMASQNQLEDIGELLEEYGQGIIETLPEQYLETTKISGRSLGIPVYKDNVATIYLAMRTDILEKYDLVEQAQNIKSVDDLEAIYKVVSENEDLVPLFVKKDMGALTQGMYWSGNLEDVVTYDPLFQEVIVAFPGEDGTKAQCVYNTQYFEDAVTKMHDWYEKGYVFKDSATTELDNPQSIANDIAFSIFFAAENATMMSTIMDCQKEMTVVPLAYQVITSQKISQLDWVIPVTSDEPEAAMKFLNLMYTDEQIVNLLNYGVEGRHYVKNDNGTISLPEGVDPSSSGYYLNMSFLIGNQYLSYVWAEYDPETRAKSKEINDNATYSDLIGFTFDTSECANAISAISAVTAEYQNMLVSGIGDAAALEEARQKLASSGMDELVAAVQEQLDAWLANK